MLGALAAGHPTGTIVDFGSAEIRIKPVVDGYELKKASIATYRGGDWIDQQIFNTLSSENCHVGPWFYHMKKYANVSVTKSFRDYHIGQTIRDIKTCICVSPPTVSTSIDTSLQDTSKGSLGISSVIYELPDGTIVTMGERIRSLPDRLLFTRRPDRLRLELSSDIDIPAHVQKIDIIPNRDSLSELIYASIAKCDIDARRELLGNIVMVGGGSLMPGLAQKLSYDLSSMFTSSIKVY